MKPHVWGIVLAGNGSERRRTPRRLARHPGRAATPSARQALFRQTVERAGRLIPADRLLAVLDREHSACYDNALAEQPSVRRVLQPAWRGSAPALYLPLLQVGREDPDATVVVLPSDQHVDGEARLMTYVARAVQAAALRPDLVLVIGAQPFGLDAPSAWIEPGAPVEGLEAFAVRTVRRFVPRASRLEQAALYAEDALVNTQVVIAKARTLIELGRRYLPDVLETLEPLEAAFGTPEEPLLCEAVYEQMPYADLAHALFVRPQHVAVVPVAGVRLRTQAPAPLVHALAS